MGLAQCLGHVGTQERIASQPPAPSLTSFLQRSLLEGATRHQRWSQSVDPHPQGPLGLKLRCSLADREIRLKLSRSRQMVGVGKGGKTPGSGSFHPGEVPGVCGCRSARVAPPNTLAPGDVGTGRKVGQSRLELNPIGPMTSLPAPEEA